MKRYDIAVVGTGAAGVSAAITAKSRNKSVVLFGSKNLSDKITKAARVENYTALPDISGKELAGLMLAHLSALDISITEQRVKAIYKNEKSFTLQAAKNTFEASCVIIATGVAQSRVIKGEKELLGSGVSYCTTCDAGLYKNKNVAVIGYNKDALTEAEFLAETAAEVLYFSMNKGVKFGGNSKVKSIDEKVLEISKSGGKIEVVTAGGKHGVDGVFVLRDSLLPDALISGLETENNHITVNLQMQTSVDGVFACGDVAGTPYQYIKAAGQGNCAALSAVKYLSNLQDKEIDYGTKNL